MASHASELEIAKKHLTDAVGDNMKQYVNFCLCLLSWGVFNSVSGFHAEVNEYCNFPLVQVPLC